MLNTSKQQVVKDFGERLRTLRTSKGLSQERLANLAEIPLSQVGKIERGVGNPTLGTISKFAIALKVPLSAFFTAD